MIGRPRNFDKSTALTEAMTVFWDRGYDATSYDDLVAATGIGRQSLYHAFGDKRSLFISTLVHYGESVTQESIDILQSAGSPIDNIRRWLQRLRDRSRVRGGCLLTNSAVEIAPHDDDIAKLLRKELQRVERTLRETIDRAIASGELAPSTDSVVLATCFFGVAQGLMVMGRLQMSQAKLNQFVQSMLLMSGLSEH